MSVDFETLEPGLCLPDAGQGTESFMSRTDDEVIQNTARLAALRTTSLLDTPPEEVFDRLTRLATSALQVPVALVSLVDGDRQFFKSSIGLPEPWASLRQTPLTHSFCKH